MNICPAERDRRFVRRGGNRSTLIRGGRSLERPTTDRDVAMVNRILQLLSIRCSHRKISQPFAASAPARRASNSDWETPMPAGRHDVVCLDCGQKFEYDWANMRRV